MTSLPVQGWCLQKRPTQDLEVVPNMTNWKHRTQNVAINVRDVDSVCSPVPGELLIIARNTVWLFGLTLGSCHLSWEPVP